MQIKNLDEIFQLAKTKQSKRIAVVAAQDKQILHAVLTAHKENLVDPVLFGDAAMIRKLSSELGYSVDQFELYDIADPVEACYRATAMIRNGNAHILMKGLVSSAPFLKAVLDKENGLKKQEVLSHVALFDIPLYHKPLAITDAAMNIQPTLDEKVSIILNAIEVFHRLGQPEPKVAILAPVELVNQKIESTVHAALLSVMNKRGQIKGCIIDGPLAFDNAISNEAAEHKGIISQVAGDADILITPDLNSGNILYKSLIFLGGATSAAIVMGASAPIVLTSRADDERSKLMSIALAAALN